MAAKFKEQLNIVVSTHQEASDVVVYLVQKLMDVAEYFKSRQKSIPHCDIPNNSVKKTVTFFVLMIKQKSISDSIALTSLVRQKLR